MSRKMRVGWWMLVMGILCLGLTLGMTCKKKNQPPLSFTSTFGGGADEEGSSVQQTSDGGFVIAGSTESYTAGCGYGVWLVKVDAWGNKVWQHVFGGADDYGYSVQQTSDGGYIISGINNSNGEGCGAWLIKTDSSGRRVWDRVFSSEASGTGGFSVRQTSDGGCIVTGWIYSLVYSDLWLLKADASGNKVWDTTFAGSGDDIGNSVQPTSDCGYVVAGERSGDVWLIKTDADGN